jgi:hypothetical protein
MRGCVADPESRKRCLGLLASDGNIGCIDAAAGVNVFSDLEGSDMLKL